MEDEFGAKRPKEEGRISGRAVNFGKFRNIPLESQPNETMKSMKVSCDTLEKKGELPFHLEKTLIVSFTPFIGSDGNPFIPSGLF